MSPRNSSRKRRYGMSPFMRRYDDLLRDVESIRRRLRNLKPVIQQMDLYAAATRRMLQETAQELQKDASSSPPAPDPLP